LDVVPLLRYQALPKDQRSYYCGEANYGWQKQPVDEAAGHLFSRTR
jgi:hypothetical protein